MKVKVTKVLAETLNKAIKAREDNYCIDSIDVVEVNPDQFMSDFVYACEEYGDVDFDDNGYNVLKLIQVSYKDDCFACPKYFNTLELGKMAKKYSTDGKITINAFIDGFLNEANI